MSKAFIFILALITFIITGCDSLKKGKPHSTKPEPVICVIAIDGTGSYNYLDRAKQTAVNILRSLPDNSKIYVRWITESSNSDRSSIVSVVIPDTKPPKNPFDVRGKKRHESLKARRNQVYTQAVKAIDSAKSPRAGRTDIYGALFAASERFNGNAEMKPLFIALTDMVDNVNAKDTYTINLNGSEVRVMNYQVDPQEDGRKKYWTNYLAEVGADSVEFKHIDEPITFSGGGQ